MIKKFVCIVALALGGCSAQQDANLKTAITNLQGDVSNVAATISAKVKQDCPTVVAAMPNVQLLTAFVFTALGLPSVGTVTVRLETSVATVCGKLVVNPAAASVPVVIAPTTGG